MKAICVRVFTCPRFGSNFTRGMQWASQRKTCSFAINQDMGDYFIEKSSGRETFSFVCQGLKIFRVYNTSRLHSHLKNIISMGGCSNGCNTSTILMICPFISASSSSWFVLQLHGFVSGQCVEIDPAHRAILLLLERGHSSFGGLQGPRVSKLVLWNSLALNDNSSGILQIIEVDKF